MRKNNSLGDKFAGFTSEPNPGVWENIERSLDEKPRRRILGWWIFWVAGVFAGIIAWNLQEDSPKKPKYVSKGNVTVNSSVSSAAPSNADAPEGGKQDGTESKMASAEHLQATDQPQAVQSNSRKHNINTSPATSVQSKFLASDEMTEPPATNGSITGPKASEKLPDDPIANTLQDPSGDRPLTENDVPKENSSDLAALPDSSAVSKPNPEIEEEKPRPATCRWQLQVQIGAFASRRDELLIPSLSNSNEDMVNVGNGGYLPITLGSQGNPVVKPYRNLISSYSVLASYNLTDRWRLSTGFSYLRYYMHDIDENALYAGAHYMQVPVIADFKLLHRSKWEWSVGTGASFGYVFDKQSTNEFSSWRSDFIAQTSLRYALTQRLSVQVQPQARFVFWDKQAGKVDQLSPWYWGGNVGAVWCF